MTDKMTILYCRVSTESQADDNKVSLSDQEGKLTDYAHSKGLANIRVYHEDFSGFKSERPQLDLVKALIQTGQVENFLAIRVDRITREPSILDSLRKSYFIPNDVKVYTIEDLGGPWAWDAFSIHMQDTLASFSRLWGKLLKQVMDQGMVAHIKKGSVIVKGNPPYGYLKNRDETTNIFYLEINPDESQWVEKVYNWYIYEDIGLNKITDRLNEMSVPCPSMSANRPGQTATKWNYSTVQNILTNKVYLGFWQPGKSGKQLGLDKLPPIPVPQIIDQDLFDLVQEKLAHRAKHARGTTKHEYLLNRRVTCDICKKSYIAMPLKAGKDNRRNKTYLYYRHTRKTAEDKNCTGAKTISVPLLDNLVWNCLYDVMSDPDLLYESLSSRDNSHDELRSQIEARIQEIDDTLATKEKEIDRLVTAYQQGVLELEIIVPRKKILTDMIESYKRQREKELERLSVLPKNMDINAIVEIMADVAIALSEIDFETKKEGFI